MCWCTGATSVKYDYGALRLLCVYTTVNINLGHTWFNIYFWDNPLADRHLKTIPAIVAACGVRFCNSSDTVNSGKS